MNQATGGDNNDEKSQMSKTQQSGFWGRGGAHQSKSVMYAGGGQYYDFHAVGQELQNVQEKIERGFANSVVMRDKKAERVRENLGKVPDTDYLKKQEEDKKFDTWHKYLLKQKDIVKK